MIPPAFNTDLKGKDLHDEQTAASKFINEVFKQMKEGKKELTFGFSEVMSKATPDVINSCLINRLCLDIPI